MCQANAKNAHSGIMVYAENNGGFLTQLSRYDIDLMLGSYAPAGLTDCPSQIPTPAPGADGKIPIESTNPGNAGLTQSELDAVSSSTPPWYVTASGDLTLGEDHYRAIAGNYRGANPSNSGSMIPSQRATLYPPERIYAAENNPNWKTSNKSCGFLDITGQIPTSDFWFAESRHKNGGTMFSVDGQINQMRFKDTTKKMWVFPGDYGNGNLADLPIE